MRYPLTDIEQYPGKITFVPVQEKYIDIPRAADSTIKDISSDISQFVEGTFVGPSQPSNNKTIKIFKSTLNTIKSEGPITLYLPQAINVADQVYYERIDLGAIGAVAAGAVGAGAGPLQALKTAGLQAGRSIADLLTNRSAMSQEVAALAALRLAPGAFGVDNVAKSQLGVAVNPNTKSLFRSVELRTFSFSFKMIASSEAEAIEIERIIKAFRTELYPEHINFTAENGAFTAPVGYKFPNKYKIILQYGGKILPIRFLDANLINIQTVYNPSSMGWHADGRPSEVDLTLSFGEPRTLSKQDIVAGY